MAGNRYGNLSLAYWHVQKSGLLAFTKRLNQAGLARQQI